MKVLRITFEKGGTFTVELDEKRAPTNVKTLWDQLPITSDACHGMLSGEMFFTKVDGLKVATENPKVMGIQQGCVAFEAIPPGSIDFPPGILIAYGEKVRFATPFTPDGEPIWMIGQITQDLDGLHAVGRRLHEEGIEKVTFERNK
jgi:hypothetical protein